MNRIKDFLFPEPLLEGIIVERKNRFIVDVQLNNEVHTCHCPCTGKIGNFDLRGRPCLLSKSNNPKRRTLYTMEALSLNKPKDLHKSWIGINQNANNRYIEHFILNGAFRELFGDFKSFRREQTLGNSKIDFLVDDVFVEVKSPLWRIELDIPDYISTHDNGVFNAIDRLMKHLNSFISCMESHQRAIMLVCFVYDHPGMRVSNSGAPSRSRVFRMFEKCSSLERWQVNLKITPTGIRFIRCFRLDF